MPTIPRKPQWNVDPSRSGYSPSKPLYDEDQTAKLAALLGCTPDEIDKPLSLAMLAIGPFISEWDEPAATEPEQFEALKSLASDSEDLLARIRGLDHRSRRRLLNEYGADGDSEGDSILAAQKFKSDVEALDRLCLNLIVARQRLAPSAKGKKGAPTISFERFAASKLLEVCKAVHGAAVFRSRSRENKRARSFVVRALMMIRVTQSAARSSADEVLSSKNYPRQ
jgi:hypothetical protein